MIYTFYSFKGGVGRSMALANVAEQLFRDGLRVLMVDFDLEAPGLERYFAEVAPVSLEELQQHRGVLDLLMSYKELRSMARRRRSETSETLLPIEDRVALLSVQPLAGFVVPIYPSTVGGPSLSLITAGARGSNSPDYSHSLLSFNWNEFYTQWDGEILFEWLRLETEKIFDVVLIDSRTGMTEILRPVFCVR